MDDAVYRSSKEREWGTPQLFFDRLDREFHFTLDAAATWENAKCDEYFTMEEDALAQDWSGYAVWLNPPYSRDVGTWVRKAFEESRNPETVVVVLLFARTDTKWWHEYVLSYPGADEIIFAKGRLTFEHLTKKGSAPASTVAVVFRPPGHPDTKRTEAGTMPFRTIDRKGRLR